MNDGERNPVSHLAHWGQASLQNYKECYKNIKNKNAQNFRKCKTTRLVLG